ncbi:uncharacterized protein LOC143291453 [Babylonia areolata]|uniref:uncharacterized protein LOC143291453 n=1 Tax=Babylonia areolata TaxID=304850 RepID=UPI003FD21A59
MTVPSTELTTGINGTQSNVTTDSYKGNETDADEAMSDSQFSTIMGVLGGLVVVELLMLVGICYPKQRRSAKAQSQEDADTDEEEEDKKPGAKPDKAPTKPGDEEEGEESSASGTSLETSDNPEESEVD